MTGRRRGHVMLVGVVGAVVAVVIGMVVIGMVVARGSDTTSHPSAVADIAAASGATTPGATTPGATVSTGPGPSSRSDTATVAATATATATATPYCGASRYVAEITVQRWADGRFRISVRPTSEARLAADTDAATAELWQAVQRCVTGLDGEVGDSLTDQLRCHEYLGLLPDPRGDGLYATGETFDVESWRPVPGRSRWISTRCGNTLGTDPTAPPVQTYRPDGIAPQYPISGEHG